jgi:hypothetical protein
MRVVVVGGDPARCPERRAPPLPGRRIVPLDHRVRDEFFLLVRQLTFVD